MIEITLSILVLGTDDESAAQQRHRQLRSLLDQFETQQQIRVRLNPLPYDRAWAEVVKYALDNRGPDVSQIGSTWVGNLAVTNALRPFTDGELTGLGGPNTFLPVLWQSGRLSSKVWAIPWLAGTRLIYYRRDWLAQAGVEAATAFDTPAHLEQTLQRLQASQISLPWVVPTVRTPNTLHSLASWVWTAGGDFINVEERQLRLAEPEALQGLNGYFGLQRFLAPAAHHLADNEVNDLFWNGQAAVTMGGSWVWENQQRQPRAAPDVIENVGVALPLQVPFVGGEHLAIWKYSRYPEAAIELVRFLTSREVQRDYAPYLSMLPVRQDLLAEPPFTADPIQQVMAQALRGGRSYPVFPRWGMIEARLHDMFGQIWADILSHPATEVSDYLKLYIPRLNAIAA